MKLIKRFFIGLFIVMALLLAFSNWYYRSTIPKTADGSSTLLETYKVSDKEEDRILHNGDSFEFETVDLKTGELLYSAIYDKYLNYNAQQLTFSGFTPTEKITHELEDLYLPAWAKDHKVSKEKLGMTRFPIAGTSVYEKIKKLRINGVPVDEVREYVDYNGKTWYFWYYKNLELKTSGNKVTFDR